MSYSPHAFGITKGESAGSKFYLADANGDIEFQDSDKIIFGDGADAAIYWNEASSGSLEIGSDNAKDVAINLGADGSTVTIAGNLTVAGTTTTVDSIVMSVANQISFEGATANDFETILTVVDPTADRTWTLPDATDTVVGLAATQTLTNKTLTSPVINTGVSGTAILDSDAMSGVSATTLCSSESIKAYVDAQSHGGGGISFDGSTANGVLTYKDADEATVEANLTYDGEALLTATSSTASEPVFHIKNTAVDATSAELKFDNPRGGGAGGDGDDLGRITFYGQDDANSNIKFAEILAEIADASNTDECGKISLLVAENDGTNTAGLILTGQPSAADGEVDVTIGAGAASVTTVAGTLTMGSTAALTNAGLVAVANQSNITGVGALDSGSITSGFGTINTGSSTITTTGLISGGSLDIDDVVINGSTIGHTDDDDLITVASGIVTVAGEISVTTLDIGGTNVTSTAAELNILDGVIATAGHLNNTTTTHTVAAPSALTSASTRIHLVDTSSNGNATITLTANQANGTTFTIKKTTSDANTVTITTSDNIDGSSSNVVLYYHNESVTLVSDSANYFII